jgi:predicted amidohydrolase
VLESLEDAARQDERARRIATDHQLWVAVASFAGSTGGGGSRSAGRSGIWRPGGVLITQVGSETGAIARTTLV